MSAGVCGKRLGFQEFFGSSPAAKRSRCSPYGSPIRSPEWLNLDSVLTTRSPFSSGCSLPLIARCFLLYFVILIDIVINGVKVVERVWKSHDDKIDDAIKSLRFLFLVDGSAINGAEILGTTSHSNGVLGAQTSEVKVEAASNNCLPPCAPHDRSSWVEFFVQEMMNASNWDDVCGRVLRILEAFERSVLTRPTLSEVAVHKEQQEIASLKDQLLCLSRDNQILKKAVAIQQERNLENDEKLKEVQQLKHIVSQYQERARTLELQNYTLKVRLQRAQEGNPIPSRFRPDIF